MISFYMSIIGGAFYFPDKNIYLKFNNELEKCH